jgi:hypothetical protein
LWRIGCCSRIEFHTKTTCVSPALVGLQAKREKSGRQNEPTPISITKDLEIEHLFEDATDFLFEAKLHVACDRSQKDNRADGRLPLENEQSVLWDCKSVDKSYPRASKRQKVIDLPA